MSRKATPDNERCDFLTTRKTRCTFRGWREGRRCTRHEGKPIWWTAEQARVHGLTPPDDPKAEESVAPEEEEEEEVVNVAPSPPPRPRMGRSASRRAQKVVVELVAVPNSPPKPEAKAETKLAPAEALECPVCLEPCTTKLDDTCGHPLCIGCRTHLVRKLCPMCRRELPEFVKEDDRQDRRVLILHGTEDQLRAHHRASEAPDLVGAVGQLMVIAQQQRDRRHNPVAARRWGRVIDVLYELQNT
jgi:hypothetical protein